MARPRGGRLPGSWSVAGLLTAGALAGCELQEVTVVDVEDVVIAEVYVNLAVDPADHQVLGLLHRTLEGVDAGLDAELDGATVEIGRSDGLSLRLDAAMTTDCLAAVRVGVPVACFVADSAEAAQLRPGDRLDALVALPDGRELIGATTIPGAFELDGIAAACLVEPATLVPIEWSPSEAAWAYIAETSVRALPDALRAAGVELTEPVDDPFHLLGLSISDDDTSIVFPSEFGIFERFDLQAEVAAALQVGLPDGAHGEVSIRAVDRNYVNWVRGGTFNPSGQVRIPSLQGDGTGVFAATVGRRFEFLVASEGDVPACPVQRPGA